MGQRFLDQYSLLHFSVGVIAFFWKIPLQIVILLHILFEYSENTSSGMYFINHYLKDVWPGGKPRADSVINRIGDTLSTIVGWVVAYYADKYARRYGWYIEYDNATNEK